MFHRFLKNEVFQTLCQKVPITMVATLIVATSLLFFLWPFANHSMMVTWYVLIVTIVVERFYHALKGCRYADEALLEARYRRFRVEALMTALLWAFATFLFYPTGHLEFELLLALIAVGLAVGGAITLAIDRRIAESYVVFIFLALGLRFVISWDMTHAILFVLTILLAIVIFVSLRHFNVILLKGMRQYRELGELKRKLDLISEQAPVGIFYFDKQFRIRDCNKALAQQIGVKREELIGISLLELHDHRPVKNVQKVFEERITVRYEGPYVATLSGKELWISVVFTPLLSHTGELLGGVAVLQDQSAEHEALEQAEFLAYHDALTHLPNRKLLEDRYTLQMAQAVRENHYSAILFLDLDRFKHINDTYGHMVGDELLVEMAQRLKAILRASDTVCRLGGDEFIIFLPMISKSLDQSVEHTWRVGQKIHEELIQPFQIQEHLLFVSTSIGVVIVSGQKESLDEVLRKADIAMYHAKKRGLGLTSFYEEEMDRRLKRSIHLEEALRHAIERNELYLQFQPIVALDNEKICGVETLLRWRMQDGTLVSPAEFIPLAEETKLIHHIGYWVIEEVCRKIVKWEASGGVPFFYVSINISSKQFRRHGFFDDVMKIVSTMGVDPRMLKFEITESLLMKESSGAKLVISRFNEVGIGFMIDDFGTGYSSLSYLKQFDFETIKIDRSFIRDILTDSDDVALVRAILDIAKQFDYNVVAEGVENEAQKELLGNLDHSIYCQGYYFSPPLDEEELIRRYAQ